KNYCVGLAAKDKEERRRNAVAFQDFLTQYFAVRTSKKLQELVGGAIVGEGALALPKVCAD
ncbi:MAG: hypothetical protein IJ779_04505, partial [Ruminococcus sp.]|nr:hypothetical protein [Ruminococcus sp.]